MNMNMNMNMNKDKDQDRNQRDIVYVLLIGLIIVLTVSEVLQHVI